MKRNLLFFIVAVSLPSFFSSHSANAQSCAELFDGSTDLVTLDSQLILRDNGLQKMDSSRKGTFEFEEKGLHFIVELAPSSANRHELELVSFELNYDPQQFLPGSYFRRILGSKPMRYSKKDLRLFAQNTSYMSIGRVIEFYLRLPNDPNKVVDEGALLAISLDNGQIIGYPAGTNVDETLNGMQSLWNSMAATAAFIKGLSLEAQGAMKKAQGNWYLKQVGKDLRQIEVQPIKSIDKK